MKAKKLINLKQKENVLLKVKNCSDYGLYDQDIDDGVVLRFISIKKDTEDNNGEICYQVHLQYLPKFYEYNKQFMNCLYYDSSGVPQLDFYGYKKMNPDQIIDHYIYVMGDMDFFDFYDEQKESDNFQQYLEKNYPQFYHVFLTEYNESK